MTEQEAPLETDSIKYEYGKGSQTVEEITATITKAGDLLLYSFWDIFHFKGAKFSLSELRLLDQLIDHADSELADLKTLITSLLRSEVQK